MKIDKFKKIFKIGLPILFLVLLILTLFIYPGFLRDDYNVEILANRKFTFRDHISIADQLAGKDKSLENAFKSNFLMNLIIDEKESDYQAILSQINMDNQENISPSFEFLLDDQLAWGEYLILDGQEKEFKNWQNMIENLYKFEGSWATKLDQTAQTLEMTEVTWPYDLKYADFLLTAYNQKPSRKLLKEIESLKDKLFLVFNEAELPANTSLDVERILYPETSSSSEPTENPELFDPYVQEHFVRLSDINLYVLESFALLDDTWQPILEKYQELINKSTQGSQQMIFYPLGVTSDLENYVATGNQAFTVTTWENIRLLYQSLPGEEAEDLVGFYKRQILQFNGLSKTYHNVSLQSMSPNFDLASMGLFSEFLLKNQTVVNLETEALNKNLKNGMSTMQYKNRFHELNDLFYENQEDSNLLFTGKNQIAILLSGLFE